MILEIPSDFEKNTVSKQSEDEEIASFWDGDYVTIATIKNESSDETAEIIIHIDNDNATVIDGAPSTSDGKKGKDRTRKCRKNLP